MQPRRAQILESTVTHTNPSKPTAIAGHVGPFKPSVDPARPGLYKRVLPETGTLAFAYWDGGRWGLASTTPRRALARKHKRSKKSLPWYGLAKAPR
jgi:hypothetical protein